jgi:hypothetical protein
MLHIRIQTIIIRRKRLKFLDKLTSSWYNEILHKDSNRCNLPERRKSRTDTSGLKSPWIGRVSKLDDLEKSNNLFYNNFTK